MNKKEIMGLCEFLKLHGYENTDNISRFIFGLQQENKQLKIQISAREEEYIKLQEENEYFNHCDEEKRKKITNLEYKIERLEKEIKANPDCGRKYAKLVVKDMIVE